MAFVGVCAAMVTAIVGLFRWADDQERSRYEQLRREITNEVQAKIYRHLLDLNMQWLTSNPKQRETAERLAKETSEASQTP